MAFTVAELRALFTADDRQYQQVSKRVQGDTQKTTGFLRTATATAAGFLAASGVTNVLGGALQFVRDAAFGLNDGLDAARLGFTTMLGSARQADSFLRQLGDFAKTTPFEFPELVTLSQRLVAMGFQGREVIPIMTSLGNAVAGLGGSTELLNRVITALGQMRAKGKVTAEEMRQLTEAGIPAWEILAEKIGVSIPQAMEMATAGAIDAETAITGLTEGMDERFGGLMDKMSTTWRGALSNIRDSSLMLIADVFRPLFDAARRGAVMAAEFLGVLADHTDELRVLGAAVAAYVLAVKGATVAQSAWAAATRATTAAQGGLRAVLSSLLTRLNPWALAISGVVAGLTFLMGRSSDAKEEITGLTDAIDMQTAALDENTRANIANRLEQDGVLKILDKRGFAHGVATDAVLGDAEAMEQLLNVLDRQIDAGEKARLTRGEQALAIRQEGAEAQMAKDKLLEYRDALAAEVEANARAKQEAEGAAGAMEGQGDAAAGAADSSSLLADALNAVADKADRAEAEVDALMGVLEQMVGINLDAEQAASDYEAALDELREGIKESGRSLDINTEKGRANRDRLREVTDAILATIEADARKHGVTPQVIADAEARIQRFKDEAQEIFGVKSDVLDLIEAYGLTPENVQTIFHLLGTAEAKERIADIQAALGRFPDEVNVRVRFTSTGQVVAGTLGGGFTERARGGPVEPGRWYRVGEAGEEVLLMHPNGGGFVLPIRGAGIFDRGGVLPHGHAAFNMSGRDEVVLSPQQTAALRQMAATGRVGGDDHQARFVVQQMIVQALGDRFELSQIEDELEWHGAV